MPQRDEEKKIPCLTFTTYLSFQKFTETEKRWFSINTQVVGNSNLEIINNVARWPSSVYDTTNFNDSLVGAKFENNEFYPYTLVGDAAYPCRVYLLTAMGNPQTPPLHRYNTVPI